MLREILSSLLVMATVQQPTSMIVQKSSGCQRSPRSRTQGICYFTAVRLKVEENQLVGGFGEIDGVIDGLKGA